MKNIFRKKVNRVISTLLCGVLAFSITGCGGSESSNLSESNSSQNNSDEIATDVLETEDVIDEVEKISYPETGVEFFISDKWVDTEEYKIMTTNLTNPQNEIYSFLEYVFVPVNNLEEINDPKSEKFFYDLAVPISLVLVVRDEHIESTSFLNSIALYDNVIELEKQGSYNFYFLSDYNDDVSFLSEEEKLLYDELIADTQVMLDSIDTFKPDATTALAKIIDGQQYISFDTVDIYNTSISSRVLFGYDLTMINFWGSYAYPEVNEVSELQNLYKRLEYAYPDQVNLIQVIIDAPDEEVEAMIKTIYDEHKADYKSIIPDAILTDWIVDHLVGLPTTIFVDNEGKIMDKVIEGSKSSSDYFNTIAQLLANIEAEKEANGELDEDLEVE